MGTTLHAAIQIQTSHRVAVFWLGKNYDLMRKLDSFPELSGPRAALWPEAAEYGDRKQLLMADEFLAIELDLNDSRAYAFRACVSALRDRHAADEVRILFWQF